MSFFKKFSNLDVKRNFFSLAGYRFLKLGQDIDGEAAGDYSGFSVSMNAAGDRIAIAAYANDVGGTKTDAGHVRVYSWNGTSWTQLGTDIDGEAAGDFSGYSVSMNAAGDRVAIGAYGNDVGGAKIDAGQVRVYRWNGTSWTQLGADIDGEAAFDGFGISVSMNNIGDRVAIGAYANDVGGAKVDAGHVRVYSWNGTSWTQLGTDIDGEAAGDYSGYNVSMNAAGDRVAIGAIFNDVGGAKVDAGHVRVYSWNGTSWTQLGADIDGEATEDQSGYSVSMNAAGDRVAIGAIFNDGGGNGAGHVRIYSWNGTSWTQLGADIDGEAANDRFGRSVSMNNIGDRVVIGATNNDGSGNDAGHVRVYRWNGTSWTQLGADINGEAAGDISGYDVSMNAAGDRVAIGAIFNDVDGARVDAGHVRVYYDYVSYNNWKQLGQDIDGEAAGDHSGFSVSMNATGDRVAIGAYANDVGGAKADAGHVRVYSWNGASWTQLGADIDGEAAGDFSGYSVSMNAAGDRVAIGAYGNDVGGVRVDAGHVRVYRWNGTSWAQLGTDIDGEAIYDYSGFSVSMNAIGDRVAIGAYGNDGTDTDAGHVRVYSWNGTSWTKLGADIDGEAFGDYSGISVSMNEIGDRVAIGAYGNDANGTNAGHVRVYSWNGTSWTKLGADIDGEAFEDYSGVSVSMNNIGDRVAIGASYNDGGGNDAGHVRIYSWNGASWTQLGADIDGEAAGDFSGYSVSMNNVGDKVSIGAWGNDANGVNSGHVRIYNWNGTSWTQLGTDIDGEAAGDYSGFSVSMNDAGNRIAVGAYLNDVGGTRVDAGHVRIFEISL